MNNTQGGAMETTEGIILSEDETRRLRDLEGIIDRNIKGFVEVGKALAEIRDFKLYRETHDTFEAFCRDKWDLGKSHAHRLMDASQVVKNISVTYEGQNVPHGGQNGNRILPINERQVRPLAEFDADTQIDLWHRAVDRSNEIGTGKVTGAIVSNIVAEHLRKETTEKIKQVKKRASLEGVIAPEFNNRFQSFLEVIEESINTGFKNTSRVAVLNHLDTIRALVYKA